MEKLLEHLGYAKPFGYAAAAYALFYWLDENASDEAKAALASTMRLKSLPDTQVAEALVEIFDRIYTSPLWQWRAFVRSALFTLFVTAIFLFEGQNSVAVMERYLGHNEGLRGFWIAPAFITIFFQNVFFDYVALFFIRQRLVEPGSKPVSALIAGTLIGVLMVWLGILVRVATGLLFFPEDSNPTGAPTEFVFAGGLPGMAVFTWLPLLAFGILAIRALTPLSWIVAKAQWFLKGGSEHPLKAIGIVAAATVFVVAVTLRTIFSA